MYWYEWLGYGLFVAASCWGLWECVVKPWINKVSKEGE